MSVGNIMKQLQAGYIIDGVEECLLKTFDKEKIDGLLKQLSFFDMDTQDSIINEINNPEQILFVANNIISRGLPTRISLELEKTILNKFNIGNLNKKLSEIGSIKYDLDISESLGGKLFRAIHIIEPRILLGQIKKIKIHSWENHLGSEFEEDFLYNKLPKLVNPFWTQIIESQRELENILRYSTSTEDEVDKFLSGSINLFNEQMIDFSIEFPYKIYNQRGLIVEIDGSQHEEKVQKRVDENRDNATDKAKWGKTIRIKTKEWHQISEKLKFFKELENEEYFKLLKLNYTDPLYQDNEGQIALQLLLVPFAIARIQKTIVNLLISNKLDLSKDEWNIAIIERDITGSKLAIDDLTIMLNSLFKLKGESLNLPKINLFVENITSTRKEENTDVKTSDVLLHGVSGKLIKAQTKNQRKMVAMMQKNDMLFVVGPAGTGKTYTAVALAVKALKEKEVRRIILTRPAIESGEKLGFLPGDLREKLDPYMQPLYDALRDMISHERLESYLEKGIIQIAPLAFMRGRTLDNAFVILDEAQNTTRSQMKMFLTRMGKHAKFIITGDPGQIDLPAKQVSGLKESLLALKDVDGIGQVYLDDKDVVRHRLVRIIISLYKGIEVNR